MRRLGTASAAGWNHLIFDGRDGTSRPLPSGVYFYRVRSDGAVHTRKMVIAR